MKIIEPSVKIPNPPEYQAMLKHIEAAGRTCYKSEDRITEGSAEEFVKMLIKKGHLSVLEHSPISVRFICDRGVSHELVRHRLCSFSQESTRYCNYSGEKFGNELTFIRPCFWSPISHQFARWKNAMHEAEFAYFELIKNGASPQEARSVLPNSLKTDIVVTANIRQWRLIFEQRCAPAAHPQMRQSMISVLGDFIDLYPAFFRDMTPLYSDGFKTFTDKGWQLVEAR